MKDEKKYNLNRSLVIKYFWQVIRHYKVSFFITLFGSTAGAFFDVYIPLQFLKLWNVLSINDFSFVVEAKHIVLYIFALGILRWSIKRASSFANSSFQANVMAGLRNQSFSYLVGHSHSFFSNNFVGSLTQKINKYARAFEKLMDMIVDNFIPLLIRFVGTIIAIYTLTPKYSLIFLIFSIVFLVSGFILTRAKLKYDVIAAESDTKTTGALADSISNHSSVLLFAGNEYEKELVGGVINDQRKKTNFNWKIWNILGTIQSLYTVIIQFIIFWNAVKDWSLGLISLPIIVLIEAYLVRLTESLWTFISITRTFYDSFSDAREMALVLNRPYEVQDVGSEILKDVSGSVEFRNVTYIYENNNQKVFDNFSLSIKQGERIALVGTSGAGKSTFVNLLMRFFNLNSGEILIDGVDISKVSQDNLREKIAFVPQDPVLFHRSLMENIRYGKRNATDEEVKEAARLAHCQEFISKLPLGYDTYVGERGVKLSGGERQRVAIARAILKNAPILILDEATSALDSESEHLIQDALFSLIKNKTAIVIAHRLSTVKHMDRIIVIENGKITEEGTHEDLIKNKNNIYKKLWDLQVGGFEVNN